MQDRKKIPADKDSADIQGKVHKMKGSLSVLKGFFSEIEKEQDPREILFLARQLSAPCRKAIASMESLLATLSSRDKGKDA